MIPHDTFKMNLNVRILFECREVCSFEAKYTYFKNRNDFTEHNLYCNYKLHSFINVSFSY